MSVSIPEAQRALALLRRRNLTILGFGADGAAHALCLRDSGVDVRIGLRADDPQRAAALAEGLDVKDPFEACEEADLIVMLARGDEQRRYWHEAVADNLVPGDAVLFVDGFALRHQVVAPPDRVDVVLVQPTSSGPVLRREFAEGRGVPTLLAVAQDPSGTAWQLGLGYAAALGGARAGIIETTVAEATDAEAFGAAVAHGVLPELLRMAFDTLVDAGYGEDVAYLACVQQAREAIADVAGHGWAEHRARLAPWAAHVSAGPLLPDGTDAYLNRTLDRVRADATATQFQADQRYGGEVVAAAEEQAREHRSDAVGRRVREMMPWLRHRASDDHRWR